MPDHQVDIRRGQQLLSDRRLPGAQPGLVLRFPEVEADHNEFGSVGHRVIRVGQDPLPLKVVDQPRRVRGQRSDVHGVGVGQVGHRDPTRAEPGWSHSGRVGGRPAGRHPGGGQMAQGGDHSTFPVVEEVVGGHRASVVASTADGRRELEWHQEQRVELELRVVGRQRGLKVAEGQVGAGQDRSDPTEHG